MLNRRALPENRETESKLVYRFVKYILLFEQMKIIAKYSPAEKGNKKISAVLKDEYKVVSIS